MLELSNHAVEVRAAHIVERLADAHTREAVERRHVSDHSNCRGNRFRIKRARLVRQKTLGTRRRLRRGIAARDRAARINAKFDRRAARRNSAIKEFFHAVKDLGPKRRLIGRFSDTPVVSAVRPW